MDIVRAAFERMVWSFSVQSPLESSRGLWDRFLDSVYRVSADFGTGEPIRDILFILILLCVLFVSLGLIAFVLGRTNRRDAKLDRIEGWAGKLERTERTVHELRTELTRQVEVLRGEVSSLRYELQQLEDRLHPSAPGELQLSEGLLERPAAPVISPPPPPAVTPEIAPSVEAPVEIPAAPVEPAPEPLAKRLKKTRSNFFDKIRSIFVAKPALDEDSVEELEAILIGSDIGVKTAGTLLEDLKEEVKQGASITENGVTALLKMKLRQVLERSAPVAPVTAPRRTDAGPYVVLIVGVNGVGKTTTVAKLANRWKKEGSSVLMVAADTFRAAAVEQLHEWGRRLGISVVSGAPDAKPQTVIFDALERASSVQDDVVIIDTAGRLHTKANLMEELSGINNTIKRHFDYAPNEVWLVVDGSTGQNAITQAREFNEATQLTGLIVTKLDGTSKGGVVVAIKEELGIPVRFIGVGEGKEDLRPFVPADFVEAIFASAEEDTFTTTGSSVNAEIRRRRREG